MLNAITVDVEDYFHVTAFERVIPPQDWDDFPLRVERNTTRLLEIFSLRGVHATFFVLGWVARKCPDLIRRIHRGGHEIGTHGYAHRVIYRQFREEFRQDLRQSKKIIEDLLGSAVKIYRAPSYSITAKSMWAMDVLGEEGIEYDSSIFPTVHDIYGIPTAPRFPHLKVLKNGQMIKEFPPSTVRLFGRNFPVAGGGYLRLFPYRLTAWAIRKINEVERQPAMIYLHPWELDPRQPRIDASWVSRFRHYQNLDSTEMKLRRLLKEFRFGALKQALDGRALEEENMHQRAGQEATTVEQSARRSALRTWLRSRVHRASS
ncbi:MAG: DUF3473 domain-containing protein [Deltaproteobacteria bacterium]|nr:DUF3473 domain-containing protein [Deltaproteobacteria bacterium]